MISAPILTVAGFAVWMCLAVLMPLMRLSHRSRMFWALFVTGVPILGWLTLYWGPTAGVGGFILGLWLLFRRPAGAWRRPVR